MTVPSTLNRAAWASLSVVAGLLLASFFLHPLGIAGGALLCGLTLFAALRPYESLQVLAALAPLSTVLSVALAIEPASLRLIEGLTLAYLTGWAARRVARPHASDVSAALRWSAVALIVAAVASAVVSGATIFAEEGGDAPLRVLDDWFRGYARYFDPVAYALLFAEGVLLTIAVADVCAGSAPRRNGIVRMMVAGAAAAATFNVLRILIDGALPRQEPLKEFVNLFLTMRVNVHHADLNAAGSFFALAWFLALGYAARERVAGTVCLVLISAGLWIAGSRVAIGATLVIATLVFTFRIAQGLTRRRAAIAILIVVLATGFLVWQFPLGRHVADPSLALRIRLGLASGAIAMAADHPFFGVGVGHFYEMSEAYVRVPNYIVRENAHNNFLQVLAELGLPGFWLFLVVVGSALAAARDEASEAAWPIVAGISAFLLTCLGGHPLLIPHAAVPFWMAIGLSGSWPAPRFHPALKIISLVLAAAFVVTLPGRTVEAVREADRENLAFGLSAWQRHEDGARFRWAGGQSTFYVSSGARIVDIPLRHGADSPATLEVRVFLDGQEANRILLPAGGAWRRLRLMLPQRSNAAFFRIDVSAGIPGTLSPLSVEATDESGLLMIGRPETE